MLIFCYLLANLVNYIYQLVLIQIALLIFFAHCFLQIFILLKANNLVFFMTIKGKRVDLKAKKLIQ